MKAPADASQERAAGDDRTASTSLIQATPSAYNYPLLIKHLLHAPRRRSPDQVIVYRDLLRYDYRTLDQRIARLANGLAGLGVAPGKTVGVLDWDSHRYLECYFAVPSMGAVLHMVNIRLTPDQILYTINHAEDDILLVHTDFLPVVEGIQDRIERPTPIVLLSDDGAIPQHAARRSRRSMRRCLRNPSSEYEFPDFDENTKATTFYTTGTTGLPKGVYFSHRQLVLHTLALTAACGSVAGHGRFHCSDVYMPITPMFHVHAWGFPFVATMLGREAGLSRPLCAGLLLKLIATEKVTFSHCVPTLLQMILGAREGSEWTSRAGRSSLAARPCRGPRQNGARDAASTSSRGMACRKPARSSPSRTSRPRCSRATSRSRSHPLQDRPANPAGGSADRGRRHERLAA